MNDQDFFEFSYLSPSRDTAWDLLYQFMEVALCPAGVRVDLQALVRIS